MANFFNIFFSRVTSLGDKLNGMDLENPDYVDYYVDYFQETSICSTIGWMGILIALGVALLFYYVICNKVYVLAKRYVWFILLALVFIVTFSLSVSTIIGQDNDNPDQSSGVFYTSHNVTETRLLNGTEDEDARDEILETANSYREQFKSSENSAFMSESLPFEMGIANGIASAVLFIVFSFLITRVPVLRSLTIHGTGIPF